MLKINKKYKKVSIFSWPNNNNINSNSLLWFIFVSFLCLSHRLSPSPPACLSAAVRASIVRHPAGANSATVHEGVELGAAQTADNRPGRKGEL